MFGLAAEFSLTRDDVHRTARRPAQAAARALPDVVVAQLLDQPALSLLEAMHGLTTRRAIELLADTGRRPNEVCILTVDCLDYDNEHNDTGAERKLGVLVHDMPKVAREGCRLPIDQATVELILAQKRTVRARYPDTPAGQLRLFPQMLRNPHGTIPMTPAHVSRIMRRWVTAIPALLDVDGSAFPREGIVAYAFRHSYAQRHADNGTPVEVLRELMGHASMVTTQGYYRVRQERARRAVQTLAPLQIDRYGHRTMPVVQELLESERLRREVGQIAVPLGLCTEPSNVKARGQGCVYRYRCVGCEHFRTDPSNQAELREYLHQLLTGRERLATTVPQLADWAQRDAMPSEEEISALRALIRRNEQILDELEPGDRAAVLEAIATTRRLRAQLRVTIRRPLQGHHPPATANSSPPAGGTGRMSGRGEAMVARRRLDGQLKHQRVIAAVDAHLAAGRDLSVAALARHAGVSRKFIYAHPDLRAHIEQRTEQANRADTARAAADGRVTIASLRADAANAKAQNHRLREQVRALEQRLSAMLGQQIASAIDPAGYEPPDQLHAQLKTAQARMFELEETLADAQEELDAVREINRELLAGQNRPGR
jgi:integrase